MINQFKTLYFTNSRLIIFESSSIMSLIRIRIKSTGIGESRVGYVLVRYKYF